MKVRIGIGAGVATAEAAELTELSAAVVDLGFDSIWLPEVLTVAAPDPMVGLAFAAAAQPRLKLGTTMLASARHPVRLAKQAASLDRLSGGRLLLTFVPGIPRGAERSAVGPAPAQRGAQLEEALVLCRRLWAGETVDHDGPLGHLEGVRLEPRPVQDPLEVWLGGTAPAALERCGRMGDGWLPSLLTPAEAAAGRAQVEAAAAAAGRSLSPEHYGVSLAYVAEGDDPSASPLVAARAKGRPVADLVPAGTGALRDLLERFLEVGFSKFVIRPARLDRGWRAELETLREAVGDLQT